MVRKSILIGVLCLLGATASSAQIIVLPNALPDTALVRPGPNFVKNLNTVFLAVGESDSLAFEAGSANDEIAFAFVNGDANLVVTLTEPTVGDTVRITVTAWDALGGDQAATSTSFLVTFDERPEIGDVVHNPREPEAGEALTLSAKITDNSGLIKAVVVYRRGGEQTSTLDMLRVSNSSSDSSLYAVTIPPDFITDRGLEYSIVAVDDRCFPDITPSIDTPAFVPVTSQGVTRAAPQPANAYRLISAPLDLQAKSPAAVFEDDLGDYDDTRWRFFEVGHRLGDDTFTFNEFPALIDEQRNMLPGKAFLLIVEESGKTITSGTGTSISTIEKVPVDLFPGWNFIGNPFTFTIPVEKLALQSERSFTLQTFADTWSDPVEQIEPFEGYAIFNETSDPDILFIDPAVPITADSLAFLAVANALGCDLDLSTRSRKKEPASEASVVWSIRVLAQSRQAHDVDTRAVVVSSASVAWDPRDRPEPPGFGDHVSVYFAHPEWQQNTARYSADVRPAPTDGAVWPLEITSTVRDNVHLTFEGLADVPPDFEVWLVDDLVQISQNLRETPTYTIAGTVAPRPLKLVVGKRGFVDDERQANQGIPTRFELFQNFPNPFNPSTTIRYGLPQASPVSLAIYNVLGEKVATLAAGTEQSAGYHAEVWDGRSDAGAQVASGVYFAQMRAGRFVQTQTMVLVK